MRTAVCGIIFNDDRSQVLLLKRRDIPVWVLPGGGIDPGESPENAVERELWEETGCRVAIVRKIAEYLPVNSLTQLTHFFECTILSGTPTQGSETKEIQYFPLSKLPKYLAPPYKGWIEDAASFSPTLIKKKIEGVSYWVFIKLLVLHPILVFRFLLTKLGIHLNT